MLYNGEIIDDRYQIVNEIGSGGMGVIYLAYHIKLEKYVVMKKFKGDVTNKSLLRNEVDILKRLHHPYLPQVYDFIEFENDIYTVIDYVDGYDLSYYVKNGYTFSEAQIMKWLKQLCEVLIYIHGQPIPVIHMDIKPANIIINADGDICLIDFGISLNQSDHIKGFSVNYSSPEQYINVTNIINGRPDEMVELDGRSDIYSLGATFYYIMSGVEPNIQNNDQLHLSQYRLTFSDALVSIIDRAMEWNINSRFKSAEKMLDALNNIKRQDKRFKKYVFIQICVCSITAIMLIAGIGCMIYGNNSIIRDAFNKEYNSFIQSYESDEIDASEKGLSILNNENYQQFLSGNVKSQLLHSVGDCYFWNDDYVNASVYYKDAYINASDDNEDIQSFFRDYLISLIKNNEIGVAETEINRAKSKNINSHYIDIVIAQLNLYIGQINSARTTLDFVLNSNPNIENKYLAYSIYGDTYVAENDYLNAIEYYKLALNSKEDISIIRKLGNAYFNCLVSLDANNNDYLTKAKDYYLKIRENYFPSVSDLINLSQLYKFTGNYDDAKTVLIDARDYYSDDCRIYIYLAIIANEVGDPKTSEYCKEAHRLFLGSSAEEKRCVTENDLKEIKKLYSYYCFDNW